MRVSVLLTVYNCGRYLQQAIDSVIGQSYEDWELLILDDGSTDPQVHEILNEITDARVSCLHFTPSEQERQESVRYATNFNHGATRTTGEYLTFLCGDDYYLPDRFRRMLEVLDEGHQVVYGSQLLFQEENGGIVQRGLRQASIPLEDAFHLVDLNSVMLTRSAFNQVGGFPTDPELWKDADAYLWRKLTAAGHRFIPVTGLPTDVKHYRPNSVSDNVLAGRPPWHHDPVAMSTAWREWVPAT